MNALEQIVSSGHTVELLLRRLKVAEVDLLGVIHKNSHSSQGLLLEAHSFIWEAISALDRSIWASDGLETHESGKAPVVSSEPSFDCVTEHEAEKVALVAGFKKMAVSQPSRSVFARGTSTLIVNSGGKWVCFVQVCGGRRPRFSGDDLSSLRGFLLSESPATPA